MQCMYLCCFHLDILSIRTLPSHVEHPRNSAAKGLFPCRSGTKINLRMLSKTFSPTESANKSSPCWTRNLYRFYTARVVIATKRFLDVKDPSESINQQKYESQMAGKLDCCLGSHVSPSKFISGFYPAREKTWRVTMGEWIWCGSLRLHPALTSSIQIITAKYFDITLIIFHLIHAHLHHSERIDGDRHSQKVA